MKKRNAMQWMTRRNTVLRRSLLANPSLRPPLARISNKPRRQFLAHLALNEAGVPASQLTDLQGIATLSDIRECLYFLHSPVF